MKETVQYKDEIVFDYIGFTDAGEFDDGMNIHLVVGENSFMENFDMLLIGMKLHEEKDIDYVISKEYPMPYLAGKAVTYRITIQSIQ